MTPFYYHFKCATWGIWITLVLWERSALNCTWSTSKVGTKAFSRLKAKTQFWGFTFYESPNYFSRKKINLCSKFFIFTIIPHANISLLKLELCMPNNWLLLLLFACFFFCCILQAVLTRICKLDFQSPKTLCLFCYFSVCRKNVLK